MKYPALIFALCGLLFYGQEAQAQNAQIQGNCSLVLINSRVGSVTVQGSCTSHEEFERLAKSLNALQSEESLQHSDEMRNLVQATNLITAGLGRASGDAAMMKNKLSHMEQLLNDLRANKGESTITGSVNAPDSSGINIASNIGPVTQTIQQQDRSKFSMQLRKFYAQGVSIRQELSNPSITDFQIDDIAKRAEFWFSSTASWVNAYMGVETGKRFSDTSAELAYAALTINPPGEHKPEEKSKYSALSKNIAIFLTNLDTIIRTGSYDPQ